MKKYIFLLFVVLSYAKIVAQDMSIEFSIEWKDKLDFQFNEFKDENIRPAYLNITYRNVSDKPLYCLKINEGKAGLPEIIILSHELTSKFPYFNYGYFKRRYFVGFKNKPDYNTWFTWDIRNDTTDTEYKIIKETWKPPVYDILIQDESTGEFINPFEGIKSDTATPYDNLFITLNNIYNFIYSNYYEKLHEKIDKDGEEQKHHYSSDITQDTIKNNSIDKFVFLKPNETYVDKYNLIGFQITGGTFTFQLDDTKSLDYVDVLLENKDKNVIEKKQLPLKVGDYELFTGNFLTNQVCIHFPGIKSLE